MLATIEILYPIFTAAAVVVTIHWLFRHRP
jgi:hypothetical protein